MCVIINLVKSIKFSLESVVLACVSTDIERKILEPNNYIFKNTHLETQHLQNFVVERSHSVRYYLRYIYVHTYSKRCSYIYVYIYIYFVNIFP